MATCTTSTISPGKSVLAQWASGCGDADYATLTYKSFGTTNAKSLNFTSSTTDTTNDLSGPDTSTVVTRRDAEISVSGFQTNKDSALSAQSELINYYHTEINAGRQPSVWVKFAGPNYPRVYHVFCVITAINEGFNTDDPRTVEFTFKTTDTGVSGVAAVNVSTPTP